jgi:hypothetical protein
VIKIKNLKKAAMFGLDARIALAIFGALSVISGAALYSAIQESKVAAFLTEIKEVEKAVAQYLLDTGGFLPNSLNSPELNFNAQSLIIKPSGVENWKGPYIALSGVNTDLLISAVNNNITYGIGYRKTGSWGGALASDMICLNSDVSCHVWLGIDGVPLSMIKSLETKIDGTESPDATDYNGRFNYNGSWMHIMTDIPYPPSLSSNT